jgi:hypothetical protein
VPCQARSDAVDYAIRALRNKNDYVRHRALVITGTLARESDAERLVPALLEAFKRERNLSFRGEMLRVMSQVTGESHPDADACYEWWQKQG